MLHVSSVISISLASLSLSNELALGVGKFPVLGPAPGVSGRPRLSGEMPCAVGVDAGVASAILGKLNEVVVCGQHCKSSSALTITKVLNAPRK